MQSEDIDGGRARKSDRGGPPPFFPGQSMDPHEEAAPLSIGYISPAWPPDKFSNGIITYVSTLSNQLSLMDCKATVLAHYLAAGDRGESVYHLHPDPPAGGIARSTLAKLARRIAPQWTSDRIVLHGLVSTIHRAIVERGLQIVELEESFGWASRLQEALPIPVCIRLHGPWFLNGAALGVADDKDFRKRVAREGRALELVRAITAPSLDVLERTRNFYGLPLESAAVIPNPVDPIPPDRRWRSDRCDPKQILFVGRFDRHKGGDLIIEAFARILESKPDIRLSFVGPDRGLEDDGGRRWTLERFVDDRLPGRGLRAASACRDSSLIQPSRNCAVAPWSPSSARATRSSVSRRPRPWPRAAPWWRHGSGESPNSSGMASTACCTTAATRMTWRVKLLALLDDPGRAATLGRSAAERCEQAFHPAAIARQTVDYYRQAIARQKSS